MGEPHQVAVLRRSIDQDEIMMLLRRGDRPVEVGEFDGLILVHARGLGAADTEMGRQAEIGTASPRPAAPALDVMGKASLSTVKINGSNALTEPHQRCHDM